MPRILVTPAVYRRGRGPWRDVLDAAGFDVIIPPDDCTQIDSATFLRHLQGIDGTLASVERYDKTIFSGSRLRAVARVGVGYDAVDVNAATETGQTALHYAALSMDSVVELLAKSGANVNAKDNQGRTPMDMANGKGGPGRAGAAAQPRPSTIALLRRMGATS